MKKRLGIILLTIALTVGMSVPAFAATPTFKDLPANHWAKPAIDRLAADGIINGYPDGTFKPNKPVSEAEFAKMAVIAGAGKNYKEYGPYKKMTDEFFKENPDYKYETWYEPFGDFILYATTDLENAYSEDPYYEITDIEADRYFAARVAAAISEAVLGDPEITEPINPKVFATAFKDAEDIRDYFSEYDEEKDEIIYSPFFWGVQHCYKYKIMGGLPDKTFSGDKSLTRAEAAQVIYKLKYKEARK